jgi:uncharacterized membrane protein required for colicin V production
MQLDTIRQFNWADIFVVILLLRIGYIALKSGLTIELFKLLGITLATYLSLHYYIAWAGFMQGLGAMKKIPLEFLSFVSFLALAVLGYLIFVVLRSLFYRFIKMETVPNLNKWGGFVLGIARAILLASLIMFILVISPISYFKNSVNGAYLGKRILKVSPITYSLIWNNLASKFMAKEKFNEAVLEVQENPVGK